MALVAEKGPDESWRDAVVRYAEPWGLTRDALETFDRLIGAGTSEDEAAWCALYDYDLLVYRVSMECLPCGHPVTDDPAYDDPNPGATHYCVSCAKESDGIVAGDLALRLGVELVEESEE